MATTTYTPDNLDAGILTTLTRQVTVESGQNLTRGRAVKIASGKVSGLATTEAFYGVIAEDVDASAGDVVGGVIIVGALVESEIDFGDGDADEFRESARGLGIILVEGN